jgi:hypothetical protein
VKKELNKTLKLKLDIKTRWNSMVAMIERLLQLKSCIQQALHDIGNEELYNEADFQILEQISKVLKPTELAVKELSKGNSNLLVCEGVFQFLFCALEKQSTELSEALVESLRKRYEERRNKDLVSLMKYLENPETKQTGDHFKYSSKAAIFNCAKLILKRNFPAVCETIDPAEVETASPPDDDDLSAQLQKSISSLTSCSARPKTTDPVILLQKEFKLYEATGIRSPTLDKLYGALQTIQPTSTASEQTFSVAGNFSTKLRNRMKFPLLNALVFLKYYFLNK